MSFYISEPHISLAVEGLDPEKIGIEIILVPKEAELFVEQHIQSPPKTASGGGGGGGGKLLALFAFCVFRQRQKYQK